MAKVNLKKIKIEGTTIASDVTGIDYLHTEPSPSGFDPLDLIIGGGFFPGGVYLLSGEKSAGKSTLLYEVMKGVQKLETVCVHAESENTLDLDRASTFGVDTGQLIISEESIAVLEEGFEWLSTAMLAINKTYPETTQMLSWDTYQSTITRAQFNSTVSKNKTDMASLKKEMDQFAGGQQEEARIIKTKLKELIHLLHKSKAFLLLLSQVYDNRDMFAGADKFTVSGGHGLHHAVSTHIRATKGGKIMHEDHERLAIGVNMKLQIIKNKQAPPYLEMRIPLFFSQGLSAGKALHDWCVEKNLVGGGSWTAVVEPFGAKNFPKIQLKSWFGQYYQDMEAYGIYHWFYILVARFLAEVFPSIRERYDLMANDREKLIMGYLTDGSMTLMPEKKFKNR